MIKTETGSVASATELERPARSAKRPEPSGGTRSQYVEGQSQAARQLYEHVRLVAPTDMSVLITGSSGTGKSMLLAVFTNRAIVRKPLLLLLTAERSRKTWPHPNFSGM